MVHKGKRLFISGIPTSGKTYLAKIIAEKTVGLSVSLDDLRENLAFDEQLKKWTNFYLDKDEKEYLINTSSEQKWNDLVFQSEGLWSAFLKEIERYQDEKKPVIFECVNLLPHLTSRDLKFPGVFLIGSSFEETLERNKKDPRWGDTEELQKLEAETFFYVERPKYKTEAEKYDYPVFEKADDAIDYCLKILT